VPSQAGQDVDELYAACTEGGELVGEVVDYGPSGLRKRARNLKVDQWCFAFRFGVQHRFILEHRKLLEEDKECLPRTFKKEKIAYSAT